MNAAELPPDLKECVNFHGHLCPGLVTGYCAAKLAMRELRADRAGDEELVAIVENDTCAVDAVQVLTGCTFGKGNLLFRDYGKMAFTFATRSNGRSIRLYFDPASKADENATAKTGDANAHGAAEGGELTEPQRRRRRVESMLARDPSELFTIERDPLAELPAPARILRSVACDRCGERVMPTRIRSRSGQSLCIPCAEAE